MVFCVDLFAEYTDAKIKRACDSYERSLNSEINGVVESAIINIMKMKTARPDFDYSCLAKTLEKLSFDGQTMLIRYKSYIAANYLKYPERFTWIKSGNYEELTRFFSKYESRLETQLEKLNQNLVASAENE